RCPEGGSHTAQGFNFVLPHDVASTPTTQANWRFCQKCNAMFFNGYAGGRCPEGGSHTAQGLNFVLPFQAPGALSPSANGLIPAPAPPAGSWKAKFTFDQFWNFTQPLEGGHAANMMFMVQDLQVATGMGITFSDKVHRNSGLAMALALDWIYKPGDPKVGQRCSRDDVTADYDK